jgi:thioredoxin 1
MSPKRVVSLALLVAGILLLMSYGIYRATGGGDVSGGDPSEMAADVAGGPVPGPVTFLELGSVGCIPCEKMKPVMKAIEERYGDRVKVIFHDVRAEYAIARQYRIALIPTQVFLDANGREFSRHQGFFEQKEIEALLASRGILPIETTR